MLKFSEMLVSVLDLPMMHSKKQIQAGTEAYEEGHGPALISGLGFYQHRRFQRKIFTLNGELVLLALKKNSQK